MTRWTHLEGTEIWNAARAAHAEPKGRHYHNFDHVERLYEIAAEQRVPYDLALDLAILIHDVIYDDQPDKERRSADWMLGFAPVPPDAAWQRAADLILSTIHHGPGGDDRLELLDLHDFGDLERGLRNRERLAREFEELAGVKRESFLAGNTAFMAKMADRIEEELDLAPEETRDDWARIAFGIRALLAHEAESQQPGRPEKGA
ncbi:hypothetical protein [Paracoccus niistensis]|uniref:HD domain-containing protein n=1 Tax=Paracoccus niistensis TaxID=632935 RepID=A0ABV6I0S6_9RHOB